MVGGNKTKKFLLVVLISSLLISTKSSKVLASSKSSLNSEEQIQFLEEKKKSQGLVLEERQKAAVVEGMKSSKDLEDRESDEKENKGKNDQKGQTDTFFKMINSIKKSQREKREAKELIDKKSKEKQKSEDEKQETRAEEEEIEASQVVDDSSPKAKENIRGNSLLGELENAKDLIDGDLPNREPATMGSGDIDMLERIVMAEAGGEPYLGQIAVTNVVLNRLKSSRYPSTLRGVIFQRSQFSPVKNGVIRGRMPNQSVKKAVGEALEGRMIVPEDTLYFVNPVLATDQTIPRTKTPVKVIGSHTFYK